MAQSDTVFPLFNAFPPEIQIHILKQCPLVDLVCLSLTWSASPPLPSSFPKTPESSAVSPNTPSTHLYALARPLYPARVYLCDADLVLPSTHPSFHLMSPHAHAYSWKRNTSQSPCHHAERLLDNRAAPPTAGGYFSHHLCAVACCKARCSGHCVCYSCPLSWRLRDWVPRRLGYCYVCTRFTARSSKNKRKCAHGVKKAPLQARRYWTHRRGRGGFDYHLWRKWYNNAAHHRWNRTLASPRKPNVRYSLREKLPVRDIGPEYIQF